jgi:hypothetical protein
LNVNWRRVTRECVRAAIRSEGANATPEWKTRVSNTTYKVDLD